jgi:TPR repeat protein
MYLNGEVGQDFIEAFKLFRLAALNGNPFVQNVAHQHNQIC